MNELNKLYQAMCLSWGAEVKDNGQVVFVIDGQEFPIKIDGMTLHLPLSEVLDSNCNDKVFFHPACENITSKETEVFKVIRRMTCMKLLDMFRKLPVTLFQIAGTKPKSTWSQKTLDLLEPLKGAKRGQRDELNNLFARMHIEVEENGLDNRFVYLKVSKGGGVSKVTGNRVYFKTRPEFPFYTEMVRRLARSEGQADNQTIELNNHTVSRGALKLAVHLFQVILPAVNNPSDFEVEATTPIAARLTSFLGCYAELADQINKVQNTFRIDFDKAGVYPIDLSWQDYMEELPDIWRQVPQMDYNSHSSQEDYSNDANSRSDLGGLFSVNSQGNQQQTGNSRYNTQPASAQQPGGNQFDTSPPQMQQGDRYIRFEIDAQGRIVHHAVNSYGVPVIYVCSRLGNLMYRQELQQNYSGGAGYNQNMLQGGQMLQDGTVLLPNGMRVIPNNNQYPIQQASPHSVYPDNSYGGSSYGSQGYPSGGLNDAQSFA